MSLAHPGSPASADSQLFFALRAAPQWDGKYTIIGQVTTGLDVLPKLQVGDRIKRVTVSLRRRGSARPASGRTMPASAG